MEYKLKQWNFRRNLDKKGWKYVGQKIAKRQASGKNSLVLLSDVALDDSTLRRGVDRNQDKTIWAMLEAQREREFPAQDSLAHSIRC
jgi:hypothetical protein